MKEIKFGVIKAQQSLPSRDLLRVPHKNLEEGLVVSFHAFGPDAYSNNVEEMQGNFSCLPIYSQFSFRELTTSESVSVVAHDLKRIKEEILDPAWLQAGPIVRTTEGVFFNPPKDSEGNFIIDEKILKSYLNNVSSIKVGNGKIYIVPDAETLRDFGYAEHGTFEQGVQESEIFARSGLARVLEHTEAEAAENLRKVSSSETYKLGVNVLGFDPVKETVLRIGGLGSYGGGEGGRLLVDGYDWDDGDGGCAFGVLKTGEASKENLS